MIYTTLFTDDDATSVVTIAANQVWRSMQALGHPDGVPHTIYSQERPPVAAYQSKPKRGFFGGVATVAPRTPASPEPQPTGATK